MIFIFSLPILALVSTLTLAENVTVTIPNGEILGRIEYSLRNITFYAFEQIPYAKPPVGDLRFKAPEPIENWNGTLNATVNHKVCYQHDNGSNIPNLDQLETEDCLILNVFTPEKPSTNNSLSVMFYIYGGGFVSGFSLFNYTGPHYLMESGIIVVTINYRVGPFGFLSTGDLVIPGNYGLKDQLLALKWVKNNIKYFGGDPKKVTIVGHSAGSASVTYHLMSKKSEGLFRGAVAQSGSVLNPWAYQANFKDYAYKLAYNANHTFDMASTSKELLTFLQSLPAKTIKEAHAKFVDTEEYEPLVQGYWFTPVIEHEHLDAFITKRQYEMVANGQMNKVPLIIGIASEEMIGKAANLTTLNTTVQFLENNPDILVNENMHITKDFEKLLAGTKIHSLYASDNESWTTNLSYPVRFYSDTSFTRGIIHHATLQSKFSHVYFYQFSYHGQLGGNGIAQLEGTGRVAHAECSRYLWVFNNQSNLDNYPEADVLTSNRYRTLLTNFVKTLNPTPEESELLQNITWPRVRQHNFQYLNINDTLSIEENPREGSYSKWVDLYEDLAEKPFYTF